MRIYDDTFSGAKIYPGKVSASIEDVDHGGVLAAACFRFQILHVPMADTKSSFRESFMCAEITKSSGFREARVNHCFFSEKTPVA